MPSAEHLATLKRPPADPAARELVARLRARLVEVFAELGAASNQIGKTYPYLESLEPATARLLRDLKGAVDPDGALNPGGLGLR
jgi:FAD/FMN-containing dehydrogenase